MPNIDKTQQLYKKFKSIRLKLQIAEIVEGITSDVYVFLSTVEDLNRNSLYLNEFGFDFIIEEVDKEDDVVLVCATVDDFMIDYVELEDVVLMLSKIRSPIESLFLYNNGKRQEI